MMQYLRTASFGALFGVTFTVAATFQVAMTLFGLIGAVLAPGIFKMNGAPASSPVQAIGVLVFLLGVCLVVNAGISAAGAGLWLGVRRFFPSKKA
ncbi:hypothetical protein [Caulobacter sp. SSI4214]|uniref:hypothetical protein n=1 Tax=Caulobacter sp. SSI4214 TaxID=2575739 RepID=UPI00143ACAA9|nr:hypothetical protein [Caulobacter sp. SSI4214]